MAVNLFDPNFYRVANGDLAGFNDAQAFQHFQSFGLNEGRQFSPFVDLDFYRASNPDLATAGLTSNAQVFSHLQNFGVAEGRQFSPLVNLSFYLNANGDLNQVFGGNREAAFNHLRDFGVNEGRLFSPFVNTNFYLLRNGDVAAAIPTRLGAFNHLVLYGLDEGRQFSPFVDLEAYSSLSSDVRAAFGLNAELLLEHLAIYGLLEGRQFSQFVDLEYYLTANSDVSQAFGGNRTSAFSHLTSFGILENRLFSPNYNSSFYQSANSDLASAGINNGNLAFQHWVAFGFDEDRQSIPDPGGTLATATVIGSLNVGSATTIAKDFLFNGQVNTSNDDDDFYQFTLNQASAIFAQLSFLSADADISILDSNGNFIISSAASGDTSDAVTRILGAGTYYVAVDAFAPSANYTLEVGAAPAPTGDLGVETPADPNIVTLFGPNGESIVVVQNQVSSNNPNDYYRIILNAPTTLSLGLYDLAADVDLQLLDANLNAIASSTNSGTTDDSISNQALAAGVYFVRAYSAGGSTSSYELSVFTTG